MVLARDIQRVATMADVGPSRSFVTAGGEGLRSVDEDVPVWVSGGLRRSLARELRRVVATSLLGPLEDVGQCW